LIFSSDENNLRVLRLISKVYPVPASDFVIIEGAENFNGQVELLDVTGKLMKQKLMEANGRISLESLNEGVYFLKFISNSGIEQIASAKVVLTR